MDLAIKSFLYRFSNYSSWFLCIRACVFVSLQGEHASFLFIFSSSVPDIDDVLTVSTVIVIAPCLYETFSLWLDVKATSSRFSSLEYVTVHICTLLLLSPLSL